MAQVRPVEEMDDESFILHMEKRHADALRLEFKVEPDRTERRVTSRSTWDIFHNKIHELDHDGKYDDHFHREV